MSGQRKVDVLFTAEISVCSCFCLDESCDNNEYITQIYTDTTLFNLAFKPPTCEDIARKVNSRNKFPSQNYSKHQKRFRKYDGEWSCEISANKNKLKLTFMINSISGTSPDDPFSCCCSSDIIAVNYDLHFARLGFNIRVLIKCLVNYFELFQLYVATTLN